MRTHQYVPVAIFTALLIFRASGVTLYVSLNSTNHVAPYSNWARAATNIQVAVDAANNGDLILVTNGLYNTGGVVVGPAACSNRVAVTKPLTVQSVSGFAVTVIRGDNGIRCVYLTNAATLIGFTLTNGTTLGSGYDAHYGQSGGGLFSEQGGVASNCFFTHNWSQQEGGGAYGGTLINCTLTTNVSYVGGGADACTLRNCILYGNYANAFGGGAGSGDTVFNCTIVGNAANQVGGGVCGDPVYNSIVYDNNASLGGPDYKNSNLYYCCTSSDPGFVGNIIGSPLFVNEAASDFHLQSNSPCINAANNSYVTNGTDFEGNPRIVGGTVDIGCYEYQTPVSQISYAWLQQFGLPINTNTDTADPDHDGMNNYQEWIAGTNPTNALSVLAMLQPVPTNSPTGLVVSWESVNNRTYFLQTSTNLAAQPAFTTVQSNIVGLVGTTSYTDTNAVGPGPYFYRVGVQ